MFGDLVTDIPQPKDRGVMFKDILTSGYVNRDKSTALLEGTISKNLSNMPLTEDWQQYLKRRENLGMLMLVYENNELRCKTNTKQGYDILTENDCLDLSFPTSTTRRGRVTKGKSPCLMESNNNLYAYNGEYVRLVNKIEMCRLQGFPDNYCDILSDRKAGSLLGDGWTLPVIEHIFKHIKND
jgi:site-specific DNA-cytosine methylase